MTPYVHVFCTVLVVLGCVASPKSAAAQHAGDIEIRSTVAGGGALATDHDFGEPVPVFESVCAGGICLYSSTDPGFVTPASPAAGLFPLDAGTTVSLEVLAMDDAVSIKVGAVVLNEVGESAELGTALSLHRHPSWQLQLPEGEVGEYTAAFKLTTPSSKYADSVQFTVMLSNAPSTSTTSTTLSPPTTTSTMLPTTTTTVGPATCGDGIVADEEECDDAEASWARGEACNSRCEWLACGDPDDDGSTTASDALLALRAAVGIESCDACICNVDASTGAIPVSAADALRLLRFAVGAPAAQLQCAQCP
jgi:cysteine-rich repeat protein